MLNRCSVCNEILGVCRHANTPCPECGRLLPYQVYAALEPLYERWSIDTSVLVHEIEKSLPMTVLSDEEIGVDALMAWLTNGDCTPADLVAAVRHYELECPRQMSAESEEAS